MLTRTNNTCTQLLFQGSLIRFSSSTTILGSSRKILDYDLFTPKNGTHSSNQRIPPVIFIHGFLGNRKNNRSSAKALAEILNTQFIVPDLRNHGTSFHETPMNYFEMTNDLTNLIDSLPATVPKDNGFLLFGHSMGAKVSMIHALRNPDLIRGVISIDNIPYTNPAESFGDFERFHIGLNTLNSCIQNHPEWSLIQLKNYIMKWVEPDEHIVNFWLSNISAKNNRLCSKIPLLTLNNSLEDIMHWKLKEFGDLSEFEKPNDSPPLLIIRANHSNFIGPNIKEDEISKFFKDFEIISIDASHWLVTEKKKEFVEIVKTWTLKRFQ